MKCKKVFKRGEGYDYFENLPDELLILIFTKLSDAQGHEYDTLTDVKLLGQCSTVSKRFNSLTCLVPTLYLSHLSLVRLHHCCHEILKKFKHIRSLRLEYQSDTNRLGHQDTSSAGYKRKDIDHIYTKAIYDPPSNYSLAVLTCTSVDLLKDQQQYHPILPSRETVTKDDKDLIYTTHLYGYDLFCLHQRLLLSIRDLKLLQTVVVTDFAQRESFTLVGEQLVQLRNKNSDHAQVQGCHKHGFCDVLSVPSSDGVVLFKNITFSLFMKRGANSIRWDDNMPQFEGNRRAVLQEALGKMLKMKAVKVNYEAEFQLKFQKNKGSWSAICTLARIKRSIRESSR